MLWHGSLTQYLFVVHMQRKVVCVYIYIYIYSCSLITTTSIGVYLVEWNFAFNIFRKGCYLLNSLIVTIILFLLPVTSST